MASYSNSTSNETLVHEALCFIHDTNVVRAFRVAPFAPIAFFAITGNFLVFAVLLRNKAMRKTINFFIANMAISDSIFTLVYLPRVITILLFGYRWLLSDLLGMIFCRMLPFLVEISIIVSVLTIVAITLDRSLAVKFPLRASITTRTCVFVILVIWVMAISVQTPTLLATDLDKYQQKMYCIVDFDVKFGAGTAMIYFKFVFIALYAIPFSITAVLNIAIIVAMSRRKIPGNDISGAFRKRREETNRKVVRMVVVVVFTFLLCWSLYFILMVLRKNGVHVPCDVLYLRLLLVHFNAALTPWLYVMFSENYRQGFADVLFKWGCRVFAASVNHPVEDNTTRDSRQISATDQDFQLQTLPTSQCGSTTQLLN